MIYFDNSATTKICERALRRYVEVSSEHFGNPSSRHFVGGDAKKILEESRKTLLKTLGGEKTGTLLFCASGSEANNLAVFGRAYAKARYRGKKILSTMGEHAAVEAPLLRLREEGFQVVLLPTVGGVIDKEALEREMTPDVILVTVMAVNNETGAAYDIPGVSAVMRKKAPEAVLHVDATQSYMKTRFTAASLGADLITVSGHKIEGPKGTAALYVDKRLLQSHGLSARILGGGQEGGLRSGTENLPGIAAFAAAAAYGQENFAAFTERTAALRAYLLKRLSEAEEGSPLTALSPVLPPVPAPHILSLTLPGVKSETMLNALSARGICVSSGSACASNHPNISGALLAFGLSRSEADCTIRISLSHQNTEAEIDSLLAALTDELGRLARKR